MMRAFLVAALLAIPAAAHAQTAGLALHMTPEVLRVTVPWPGEPRDLAQPARGGGVSLRWRLALGRVRGWWLPDEDVAELTITRTLMPDLLGGGWRIEEQPSGLVWHEAGLSAALARFASLHDFPAFDRSLLSPGERYRLHVEIELHPGTDPPTGWWSRLWISPVFSLDAEFRAP